MKKLVWILVIILVSVIGYFTYKYIDPTNNGKVHSDKFRKYASRNNVSCTYTGFGLFKKKSEFQVYTTCSLVHEPILDIETEEQYLTMLNKYIVEPNLSAVPTEEGVFLVIIMQVQSGVVLCTSTANGKIIKSWFDSYENYCLP